MAGRFVNPFTQFFDDSGHPLIDGKLYFFESGSATNVPKQTFADINLGIKNKHPVDLTGAGRMPEIWFDGSAKCILTNKSNIQIAVRDPVFTVGGGSDINDWNGITIYNKNAIVVGPNGLFWISIEDLNQQNVPATSKFWTQFLFVKIWNPDETYAEGGITQGDDGLLYRSLINNNKGNDPVSNSAAWGSTSKGASNLVQASSTVYAYNNFAGAEVNNG